MNEDRTFSGDLDSESYREQAKEFIRLCTQEFIQVWVDPDLQGHRFRLESRAGAERIEFFVGSTAIIQVCDSIAASGAPFIRQSELN